MNEQQTKGTWTDTKGKVKEGIGELTDDERLRRRVGWTRSKARSGRASATSRERSRMPAVDGFTAVHKHR